MSDVDATIANECAGHPTVPKTEALVRMQVRPIGHTSAPQEDLGVRFSILHLSDLHRDLADEIPTASLLNSLDRDLEHQADEDPTVLRPSLCVVTGDMVFGASASATAPDDELGRQYAQAQEFLVGLADRFFGGDRERVAILPGNHDVSLPAFMACAQRIDIPDSPEKKKELVDELFGPRPSLRWSWKNLCFYRISDDVAYRRRMDHFARLYHEFYNGHRSFATEPEQQYDAFDFPDLSFSLLTLSSCYNNDPLRRAGRFHPTAVSDLCKAARAPKRAGWVLAAAWHHSISGTPGQDDYLDSGVLQNFIDSGVSMALHGHQHLPDCIDERYRVAPQSRKITIISAGTLCAGPLHLHPGEPRSFNIVELDPETRMGRVHHRKMVNHDYSLPIWGPGQFVSTTRPFIDFEISPPLGSRPAALDLDLLLERADRLVGAERWSEALDVLRPHRAAPLARPLLARALSELDDDRQTIDVLMPPRTPAEAVLIGGAVCGCGTQADVASFLASPIVARDDDGSVHDIARRVRGRRAP